MSDGPIRVSSKAWTGSTPEPNPPRATKKPPSVGERLLVSTSGLAISVYGMYDALVSGETSARWDDHIARAEEPVAFGIGVAVFFSFGFACLAVMVLTAVGVLRKRRASQGVEEDAT